MGQNDKNVVERRFPLSTLDLATLLFHVCKGTKLPDQVGYEDANYTLEQLIERLDTTRTPIKRELLESALWSCNLMDEAGQFESPVDASFESFVKRILKEAGHTGARFDRKYNLIREPSSSRVETGRKEK